jgi:hypothetical protein
MYLTCNGFTVLGLENARPAVVVVAYKRKLEGV